MINYRHLREVRTNAKSFNYVLKANITTDDSLSIQSVIEKAIDWYNTNNGMHIKYPRYPITDQHVRRIIVNYIRHKLTNYDVLKGRLYRKLGNVSSVDACNILRDRVNDVIEEKYKI